MNEKEAKWNPLKSKRLKRTRGMSFDDILQTRLVAIKDHPARAGQQLMLFEAKGQIWLVPCVVEKSQIFLKTLYPSRKYTKMFKRGEIS